MSSLVKQSKKTGDVALALAVVSKAVAKVIRGGIGGGGVDVSL